jgi:hypothetical protein
MFQCSKNSKKQGDVGLSVALAWFAAQGATVSVPLTDSQDYDLVIERYAVLERVQVRTTRFRARQHYVVNLRVNGGNRSGVGKSRKVDALAYDQLFVLAADGQMYLFPKAALTSNWLTLNDVVRERFGVGRLEGLGGATHDEGEQGRLVGAHPSVR